MLPQVVGEFRVAADPELRYTPSGKPVANLRVVANSRKKNEAGEWVDDKSCWLNVTVWGRAAENVAESVVKGGLITVKGRLETRSYETTEGEKRTAYDLIADDIGLSLAMNAAKVQATERAQAKDAPGDDPWVTPGVSQDEPPF